MRSRLVIVALALAWTVAAIGCGSTFPLPTETRTGRSYSTDNSYQMVATWEGMDGIADILLTQGIGTQLFILFQNPGTGTSPRGSVSQYALKASPPRPAPIPGRSLNQLFNPHALCSSGSYIYVLDQGDTALARDPVTQRVTDLSLYWRVRQYSLLGGNPISTFTDTSMAYVQGIAADDQGRVYVSGSSIELLPDPQDARILTRSFVFQVRRYHPVSPGAPEDPYMPGDTLWRRDATPYIEEGSGLASTLDPRGLYFVASGITSGPRLYYADLGKNWVQAFASIATAFKVDAARDTNLAGPEDVTADRAGFFYVADTGNQRVLRFDQYGAFIQQVNVELDDAGLPLVSPVAVAADDSLVYVGDRQTGKVVRYQRRR
ncbi:MAG TPA: hypothetical protein VJY35_11685 [Candidatus Eisenbacteria bacterium]|nr:hypothetical protein [Candidatus Eisenbacteria bacterium]